MAISLKDLRTATATAAPRIVIYGPEGMGKTTLASEFPDPVFLQVEEGTPAGLELASFGHLTSFALVMDALAALYTEENAFRTVAVDSLSELEKLVFAETCARNQWPTIEKPGYGKGYKEAEYVWQEFLDGVNALRRDRGMTIVLIAHAKIDRFDDPQTQSYSRYDLALHDRAKALVAREADAIFLVKQEVTLSTEEQGFNKQRAIGKSGETRWIYCEGRPAYSAKNRYGMPDKIMFPRGAGYAAIANYFPGSKQQVAEAAE